MVKPDEYGDREDCEEDRSRHHEREDDRPFRKPKDEDQGGGVRAEFLPDNVEDAVLAKNRFNNRRRMAWVALLSIIGLSLISIFYMNPDAVPKYDAIFGWFYGTMSAVVLGYMGAATYTYTQYMKHKK